MGTEVDTEARQQALLRRIEELAAQGEQGDRPEMTVLAAALTGLRAELGGLRADVGSLRAELTTVRAALDSSAGRLSSELTVARSESAGLNRRQDDLADQLDGLVASVGEVRRLLPELRASLQALPGGDAVDAALARVADGFAGRVETVAEQLRGSLASGLEEVMSAGTRAAGAAATEARGVVEERLATVEDSLDGLAEGLEALTRDSIAAAAERIAALEERITSLTDTTLAQRAVQQEWAQAVRGVLADLGSAVDRSLGAVSTSLISAVSSAESAGRTHLEQSMDTLAARVGSVMSQVAERVSADREAVEARIAALDEANTATRALVREEAEELRGDLADALEEVRDRITAALAGTGESISDVVTAQRSSYDELTASVQSAQAASQQTGERMHDVEQTVVALDAAVTALRADWSNRTHAVVSAAERAARAVTDEFRQVVEAALGQVADALENGTATVGDNAAVISEATNRLVSAGQALLGYLAERDFILENERDRVLHDVFDAFAEGLSAKERRWAAGRLADALDRRRDLRDAGRWRALREQRPPIGVPSPPQDLAALAAPAPTRPATSPAGSSGSASHRKKAVGKSSSRPPVKPTPAKTVAKRAAAKKSPAKKSASGTASTAKAAVGKAAAVRPNGAPVPAGERSGPASPAGSAGRLSAAPDGPGSPADGRGEGGDPAAEARPVDPTGGGAASAGSDAVETSAGPSSAEAASADPRPTGGPAGSAEPEGAEVSAPQSGTDAMQVGEAARVGGPYQGEPDVIADGAAGRASDR